MAWGRAGNRESGIGNGFAPPPAKAGGGWEGVASAQVQLAVGIARGHATPPQPSPAFAGDGARSDAQGTHAARPRSAVSKANGPAGPPRRNCRTTGSLLPSRSTRLPENTTFPLPHLTDPWAPAT